MNKWSSQDIQTLKQLYGIKTINEICKLLNHSDGSIRGTAYKLGLKSELYLKSNKIYTLDEQFFAIPNLINSYYAGFIGADGCIRGNRLVIGIHYKDKNILEKLKEYINYNGPIKQYQCENNNVKLSINCKNIIKDLKQNFNITERKTFTLFPPTNLSYDCQLAYIIGYIDGDGCISELKDGSVSIRVLGTFEVLNWIKDIFDKITSRQYSLPNAMVKKYKSIFTYGIVSKRAYKIGQKLKNIDVPKLERKWSKIDKYVNKYD